jgi:HlyD family secretion protein
MAIAEKYKRIILIGSIVLVVAISLIWWTNSKQVQNSLTVSGTVQAAEVQFGSREAGRVSEVFAKEGEFLKKGQPILRLEAKDLEARRAEIISNIEAQKAILLEKQNGPRKEEIESARESFQKAQADYELNLHGNRKEDVLAAKASMDSQKAEYERAQQVYNRRKNLFDQQLVSKDQLEEAQAKLKSEEKKLEERKENFEKLQSGFRKEDIKKSFHSMKSLEATYKELLNGTRPEKIATESNKLKSLEAQLDEIDGKLNELSVDSPCNCELSEFEIKPGSIILQNQILGTLIDLKDLWVEAYLPEEFYGRIWPGDVVQIISMSYPNKKLFGRVRFIGLKAEFTPRNIQTVEGRKQQVFKVKVALNNQKKIFRPGMDLDLKFQFRKVD